MKELQLSGSLASLEEMFAQTITIGNKRKCEGAGSEPFHASDFNAYMDYYWWRKQGASKLRARYFLLDVDLSWLFFLTPDGRIGSGHVVVKIGDLICVLFGGRVPYIIRPVGCYYKFIGECLVPGLMYGEAVEDWKASRLSAEEFIFQ
jgi:hypothetical protein